LNQRALRDLKSCCVQRGAALALLCAVGGCQQSLDLDAYSFIAVDAGQAGRPTDLPGAAGAGGSGAGGRGTGGTDISGGSGSGGSDVDASSPSELDAGQDSGSTLPDAGAGDASTLGCGPAERCVPAVPAGWQGPIAVSEGGAAQGCPGTYPTPLGELNAGLDVGAVNCSCGCIVGSVVCRLQSANTKTFFAPTVSCESPPTDDDCLTAVADSTCSPQPFEDIRSNSWDTTELSCGGAVTTEACSGGACYPELGGFGKLCISALGDLACPGEFPGRTLYHQTIADDRDCAPCTCEPEEQACQIELEICSTGFFDVTLQEGDDICLNSSDDKGVSLISAVVVDQGTCQTAGGTATGSAVPAGPVTVCCLD
jgi:hypothetical protein